MRALCAVLLAAAAAGTAGQGAAQWAEYKAKAQSIMDWGASANLGAAVSFAWKDSEREFQITAGQVDELGGKTRPLTADDTFLYGSGSKPFTAAAIMRLVEAGKVRLDDPAEMHADPWLLRHGNITLRQAWGPEAANVTVRMLIEMRSGAIDYDADSFDDFVLHKLANGVISPLEFITYPSTTKTPFICPPGTCVEYSSTNFVLAGIVLLHHSGLDDWTQMYTRMFFSPATQRSLAGLNFFTDQPLTKWLTTTAQTGFWQCTPPNSTNCTRGPTTTIGAQNGSIVGWTCANVVATPLQIARFYHALLAEKTVVSQESLNSMQDWRILNVGWGAGRVRYGGGLMYMSAAEDGTAPGVAGGLGDYIGHGGVVYGYLSVLGYFPSLNATLILVINTDQAAPDQDHLMCALAEAAVNILNQQRVSFNCSQQAGLLRPRPRRPRPRPHRVVG
eukprot:TRINITY_DN169_c0_g1_i3.p1 TRINITY_DN169_c0_g1~~TRINITY_DN169_c0_g1_i3.p1  ORF type:complete len:447 (+),score=150.41 TRINITY_DN169_c0_g1_i3:75-1415(+)